MIKKLGQKLMGKNILPEEVLWDTKYFDVYKHFKKSYKVEELGSTLNKGCDVLEELGIPYWLGRGTLLGLHRDGKFIPGDNDIDVGVLGGEMALEIIKKMPKKEEDIQFLSILPDFEKPNILISLNTQNTLHKLYGFTKNYTSLAFFIDEPQRLKNKIENKQDY